jgi:hypothetical protein
MVEGTNYTDNTYFGFNDVNLTCFGWIRIQSNFNIYCLVCLQVKLHSNLKDFSSQFESVLVSQI